jgi:hypothetical protein
MEKRLFRGLKNPYNFRMAKNKRLMDEYQFPGFRPYSKVQGIFGDSKARVIRLKRTQKKRYAAVAVECIGATTTSRFGGFGTCLAGMRGYTWKWRFAGSDARGAQK